MRWYGGLLCVVLCGVPQSHVAARAGGSSDARQTAHLHAAPVAVTVLLPAHYHRRHHWPVTYVLNCDPCDELLPILRRQPFISVVETAPQPLDTYVRRADGAGDGGPLYANRLVRWTDRHYRTAPDRAHRALTGVSAGGYGALLDAARYPDRFGYVAGFSAPTDLRANGDALEPAFTETDGPTPLADVGAYGEPLVDDPTWAENNPGDLASDLAGTSVFFSSGTGAPCSLRESPVDAPIERLVRTTQVGFAADLRRAHVRYRFARKSCGAHDGHTWAYGLTKWLGQTRPFATPPPKAGSRDLQWVPRFSFDHWSVTADSQRAVSPMRFQCRSGSVTLQGTGRTSLVSPPLAPGGRPVTVRVGHRRVTRRADGAGRVHLAVSLGPAELVQAVGPYPGPGLVPIGGVRRRIAGAHLRCRGSQHADR